jgi:hypothetical protein
MLTKNIDTETAWQPLVVINIIRADKTRRRTEFTIVFSGGANITVSGRHLHSFEQIRRAFGIAYPGCELPGSAATWREIIGRLQRDGAQP